MQVRPTTLQDAVLILPEPVRDERGWFMRVFCDRDLERAGLEAVFRQRNTSHNHRRGTLRGMHFQRPPDAEVKLVRCIRGAIHDVIIDLRPTSPSFLRWEGFTLTEDDPHLLYVPRGFAHGYLTLADDSAVSYATSAPYAPKSEGGVRWDDPCFGIDWPEPVQVVSPKDRAWPDFDPATGGLEC